MTDHRPTPVPPPDPDVLAAIAARYGVSPGAVRAMPQGEANHTVALGEHLVLRVPRDDGPLLADLRKERMVLPVAASAGIPVPEIVTWDASLTLLPVPYMVMARLPGTDLARAALPKAVASVAWRSVGEALRRLHSVPTGVLADLPLDLDPTDPSTFMDGLVATGALDDATARWVRVRYDRITPHVPRTISPVLIHGDIADRNVLVDPASNALTGLIDWGDAALADPAQDFAKLPLPYLLDALAGYTADDDARISGWQARALRYHLHWGVGAIARAVATETPIGDDTRRRLLIVTRFVATAADPRWRWLRIQ